MGYTQTVQIGRRRINPLHLSVQNGILCEGFSSVVIEACDANEDHRGWRHAKDTLGTADRMALAREVCRAWMAWGGLDEVHAAKQVAA